MPEISIQDFFSESKAYFIAVEDYQCNSINNLTSPIHDVNALKEILSSLHAFKIDPVENTINKRITINLKNPLTNPTSIEIIHFLKGIKTDEGDRVIIYFAGHGIAIDSEGNPEGYILGANATPGEWDTFIKMKDVLKIINTINCKHLLLILDCCYAGAFRWANNTRSPGSDVPKTIYYERFNQYANNRAWQVLTSSAHDQKAIDTLRLGKREKNNDCRLSPFASLLVGALETGEADLGYGNTKPDGIITATELSYYLKNEIFNSLFNDGIAGDKQQLPMLFPIIDTSKEQFGKGEFVFLNPSKKNVNGKVVLNNSTHKNPYKGLESYGVGDNKIFYGRQRVLDGWKDGLTGNIGLIEASKRYGLIILIGPSGIGKSSLAKAGLLSYYQNEKKLHEIRPGKTPIISHQNLLSKLSSATKKEILLVDQYEELITAGVNEEEQIAFEEALNSLINKHLVIATLRSDYEHQFKNSILLNINKNEKRKFRFNVPPFSRDEIEEIVAQPAILEVLEFKSRDSSTSDKFINRIVDEAFQNTGTLPLLSLALSTLYDEKDGNSLLESKYNGLLGILDTKVTKAYEKYESDSIQEELFRNLIYRTISIEAGQIAKRKVYYVKELDFKDRSRTFIINQIRETLEKERLFNTDVDENGDKYTEPSHDAFLRSWPLLTKWLQEKASNSQDMSGQSKLLLLKSVSDIALTYSNEKEKKKKKNYLWIDDPRLGEARKQIFSWLNAAETDFIIDSINEKKRKTRVWWITAVIVSILIVSFGVVAFIQAGKSAESARKNKALYLASESDKYLPSDAIRLLKESYNLYPENVDIFRKLNELMEYTTDIHLFPVRNFKHRTSVKQVVFSESDSLIISICNADPIVRLWTLNGKLKELKPPGNAIGLQVAFIKPTNLIALLSSEKVASSLTFWDKKGNYIRQYVFNFPFSSFSFSRDGNNLLAIQQFKRLSAIIFDISNVRKKISYHELEGSNIQPLPLADSFQVRTPVYGSGVDSVDVKTYSYKNLVNYSQRRLPNNKTHFSASGKIEIVNDRFLKDSKSGNILHDFGTGVIEIASSTNGFIYVLKNDSILRYEERTDKIRYYQGKTGKNLFALGEYIVEDENDISETRTSNFKIITNGRVNKRLQYDGQFIFAFGKAGKEAISVDGNYIRLWNLAINELREIQPLQTGINNTSIDEAEFVDINNNVIAKSADHDLTANDIYDSTNKFIGRYDCISNKMIVNKSLFYCIDEDGLVEVNKIKRGEVITVNEFDFKGYISDYCFSPDGLYFVALQKNSIVRVNLQTEKFEKIYTKNQMNEIYATSLPATVIAVKDKTLLLLSFDGKQEPLQIPSRFKSHVQVSDNGNYMVAFAGKEICFFDIKSKKYTIRMMPENITGIDFFPETPQTIVSLEDAAYYIYFIQEDRIENIYMDNVDRKLMQQSIKFTKEGKRFIIELENKIMLFNSEGSKIAEYGSLKKQAQSAEISQDGSRIIFITRYGDLKYIYTPEKILDWLKTAPIAPIMDELKTKYQIDLK